MTSSAVSHQEVNTASFFVQAWKSVRKHFPNSYVENNPDTHTSSILLHPIQGADLTIEFCFNDKNSHERPDIHAKSGKLSDTFVGELEKILYLKCANLTEWINLGDELEGIMQCVEIKREKKVLSKRRRNKKSKSGKNNNKDLFNSSLEVDEDDCEEFFSQNELSISLEAVRSLHSDLNSLCKLEEKKPRPNYFIAIRIHNKDIACSLSKMQNSLVRQEELLSNGVIPSEVLHFTLCNLGLDSANDLLLAIETMNQMKHELQEVLPKTPFTVHGASKFYNRTIYAKVKTDDSFHIFRDVLVKNLSKAGVEFREDHEVFNPHVTVIKVRRPERKAFGNRHIEHSLYCDFVDVVHGEQKIDAIYLCAMGGQKREDGFYVTACELHFKLE